jgi:hypothetical protein
LLEEDVDRGAAQGSQHRGCLYACGWRRYRPHGEALDRSGGARAWRCAGQSPGRGTEGARGRVAPQHGKRGARSHACGTVTVCYGSWQT